MSARVYETDLGNLDTSRSRSTARSSRSIRSASRRRSRSSGCSARPSGTRSCRSSCSASPRSSRSRPTRRTRSSRRRRSRRTSSTGPRRRSPSTARCSSSTRTTCAPSTRSSSRYLEPRRAGSDLLGRLRAEGRSRRRPRREEAASTTRSAPSTSASSATCRGRSTRTAKILELDPGRPAGALAPRRPLRAGARTGRSSSSVLTRESEMTGDAERGDELPVPDRGALREAPRRRAARRRALSRASSSGRPDHEPTLAALEGLKDGERDPLGAAAVLEPVYEATSDWPKLIRVHEVQVQRATDPFQKVDLLHRIARLYEDALDDHALGVRDVRARPADRQRQRADARQPRAPRDGRQSLAERRRALRRGARQARAARRPGALRRARAAQRADLRGAARGRGRRDRALPPRRSTADAENLDRDPCARSALRADGALGGARQRPRARGRDRASRPTRSSSSSYRLGQVLADASSATSTARSRAYREVIGAAPEHQRDARGARGALRRGREAGRGRRDPRAALPRRRASGRSSRASTRRSSRTPQGQEERLAAYYRIAELSEEKLLDSATTLEVYIRALKEFPLDEKAGEEAPRLAATVDGGWETLANAYADVLGAAHRRGGAEGHRPAPRAHVRGRARRRRQGRGDVQVRPRGRRARTPRRSRTSIASTSRASRGPSSRRSSRCACRRPTDALELVELYARLGELYETRLNDVRQRDPRVPARSSTSSTRRTTAPSPRSARIYEAAGRVAGARRRLRARARERLRRLRRGGDPREDRAPRRRQARPAGEGDRDVEGRARPARRGPGGARTRSRTSTRAPRSGRGSVDVLEREFDIASSDEDRVEHPDAPRARTTSDKLGRDDAALDDWNRVLDIDYANLGALRAIAAIRRRQGDAERARRQRCTSWSIGRRRSSTARSSRRSSASSARRTASSSQQPFDAAEAWRKLLDVGPDFEAMDALEAIYRADEKWTDVIDVKMRRAEALDEPAEQIEELRGAAALWREQVGDADGARGAYEKILEIDAAHDEAFAELEKLHTAASRWEPLVELYLARLETREEVSQQTETPPQDRARLRGEARRQGAGARRARQRARRWTSTIARPPGTSSGWRRRRAAGPRSSRRSTGGSSSRPSRKQKIRLCLHLAKWYGDDLGHPEYAQPYYAQIIQLDPHNVGAMRQLASLYKKAAQLAADGGDAHAGPRGRDQRPRSQGDPQRARRAARRADAADRPGDRSLPARARGRSALPAGAREPRAHLRRARPEPRARRRPPAQGPGAPRAGRDRRRPSCASRSSTRRAWATRRGPRRSTARSSRPTPTNLAGAPRARRASTRRSSSGPSS